MATKNNFSWHEITENEREDIRKDAKKLMDDFSKTLDSVEELDLNIEIEGQDTRNEGTKKEYEFSHEFKEAILKNAPKKNKDFIIAEKGKWTKEGK